MASSNKINTTIAFTYITSNKKLTAIAALGVILGIAVYIFQNSLLAGFDKASTDGIFRSTPAVRIYKEEVTCEPIENTDKNTVPIIVNSRISPQSNTITNPNELIAFLKKQPDVTVVAPQLNVSIFYNIGRTQIPGQAIGILPNEAEQMYSLKRFVVEGSLEKLKQVRNGVVLGSGIAKKIGAKVGDNVSATSSKGIQQSMKVVGIFQMNNSAMDKTRCYINIAFAQQLLKENNTYITDINVSITNHKEAKEFASRMSAITHYKAEDWESANETLMAASKMRSIIISSISILIVLVAGFGIYNILNMTVSQKINDIAILKAIGFKGKDVIRIFVLQALIIGCIGVTFGALLASVFITIVSNIYVGGDIGFFPIGFGLVVFLRGIAFGLVVTFLAGYIPARRAANIDPVDIFRK